MKITNTFVIAAVSWASVLIGAHGQVVDADHSDPGIVSAYASMNGGAVTLTLYRQEGDKYTPFALGEVKGRIEFNSKGIVGNVDALQRLQFSQPKDQWLTITNRVLVGGKAVVTTEDGKSYRIFNLGISSFAGQIESAESSFASAGKVDTSKSDNEVKAVAKTENTKTNDVVETVQPAIMPNLVIIPGSAQDKGFTQARSRFVVNKKDGRLVATGSQSMSLKIDDLTKAQVGMQPDMWGLGGEHAFQCDYAGWGNDQFQADITTDPNFPITFEVVETGYAYLCGNGTIKVKDGKEYRFGYDIGDKSWIAGIQSTNQLVREGCCEAVGRLNLKSAVPSLIGALKDPAWKVRRNACEALRLLGDDKVIKSLEECLNDQREEVQKAAKNALKYIQEGNSKDFDGEYMFQTKN